ncbi:hypothetical protein PoB_000627500 [Plakobranchus ocellatus]|uniref:Secreted protein n=1 Tax=Plakobranchus ocellatus TaxID=259542 RepID=A0AAV3YAG8_9GAST|nr:hypothetical protein PoB_000627500 [Plakobranchus ocellatus]
MFLSKTVAWITAFISFEKCFCILFSLKVRRLITSRGTFVDMLIITLLTFCPSFFSCISYELALFHLFEGLEYSVKQHITTERYRANTEQHHSDTASRRNSTAPGPRGSAQCKSGTAIRRSDIVRRRSRTKQLHSDTAYHRSGTVHLCSDTAQLLNGTAYRRSDTGHRSIDTSKRQRYPKTR